LNAKDKYKNSIIQNKNEGNHKFFIFNLLLKFIYIYIYILFIVFYILILLFIYLFIYFEFYIIFNYKLKIFNDV